MRTPNYIRFDWAIKKLLRNKANFEVLEGFIEVFTGKKCTIEAILESEGNQEKEDDKFNRVDIKARDMDGEIFIVEVQLTRYHHYMKRLLYGVSKAVVEQLCMGDNYAKLNKVYSISLVYFDYGKVDDYLYVGETKFEGIHTHNPLTLAKRDELSSDEIENYTEQGIEKTFKYSKYQAGEVMPTYYLIMVKAYKNSPLVNNAMTQWMEFLKDSKISPDADAPGLSKAKEVMKVDNMPPEERQRYLRHLESLANEREALWTAHHDGVMEGRAEGRAEERARAHQEKLDMARKMKADGMPDEIIAKYSGLADGEVKSLH